MKTLHGSCRAFRRESAGRSRKKWGKSRPLASFLDAMTRWTEGHAWAIFKNRGEPLPDPAGTVADVCTNAARPRKFTNDPRHAFQIQLCRPRSDGKTPIDGRRCWTSDRPPARAVGLGGRPRKPHPFAPSLPQLTDEEEDKLDGHYQPLQFCTHSGPGFAGARRVHEPPRRNSDQAGAGTRYFRR